MPELAQLTGKRGPFVGITPNNVVALVFALAMMVPDWPQIFQLIYGYPMRDRSVYEAMLSSYQLPTDYIRQFSPVMYFTQEWTWNTFLAVFTRVIGLPVGVVFTAISIFVLWRFAHAAMSRGGWICLVLLINPLVVDFAFSQLRLALAIALISFFWEGRRPIYFTIAAYLFCMTIHTSIVAFAAMHIAAHFFRKQNLTHLAGLVSAGVAISLALGPLREPILSLIGDRRADYPDMSSTIVYLSFWIVAWAALLIDWRQSMRSLDARYAVIVLSLVVTNIFHNGYSTRFVVAAFPSLLIALRWWMPKSANYLLLGFCLYSAIQWLYWLRIQ